MSNPSHGRAEQRGRREGRAIRKDAHGVRKAFLDTSYLAFLPHRSHRSTFVPRPPPIRVRGRGAPVRGSNASIGSCCRIGTSCSPPDQGVTETRLRRQSRHGVSVRAYQPVPKPRRGAVADDSAPESMAQGPRRRRGPRCRGRSRSVSDAPPPKRRAGGRRVGSAASPQRSSSARP